MKPPQNTSAIASRVTKSEKKERLGLTLSVTNLKISELKLDALNPRIHSDRQIAKLGISIEEFGFLIPILVDSEHRVVAGHGRVEAARSLGLQSVPAISISHLSRTQLRAFMIADNRLAEHATWDQKLLGEHFKALSEVDLEFDLEATGFEVAEIDLFIEGLNPNSQLSADSADDIPSQPRRICGCLERIGSCAQILAMPPAIPCSPTTTVSTW